MNAVRRNVALLAGILLSAGLAFATTPTIVVQSPTANSGVTSAVHYAATATSSGCSKGMAAMQVYSNPGVLVYDTPGGRLDTYISLRRGTYNTTIQAWDMCGGYAKANIAIKVTAANPIGGYLYISRSHALNVGTPQGYVQGFVISSQGSLTANGQGSVKANELPWSVAADKGGYRLYAGDYQSGDVFAYFINRRSGYLSTVPGSPFPVHRSVTAVAVAPSGHFVFAARDENSPGDGIGVFHVNPNGSLTEVAGSPFPTENDPQSIVVSPSGKYLYAADDAPGKIDAFAIDEVNGALTPLPGSPYIVPVANPNCGVNPQYIINLGNKYVYTADVGNSAIAGFSISSAGTLSDVPGSPFLDNGGCNGNSGIPTNDNPEYLAIDGSGNFLYGANGSQLNVSIYSINSNGSLTFIKNTSSQAPDAICQGPLVTDASGNHLYGVACGSANVPELGLAGFTINHTTGDLTPVPGSPFLTDPGTISYYIPGMTTTP